MEKAAIARPGIPLISMWNDNEKVRKKIIESVSSPELITWHRRPSNQDMREEAIGLANLALSKTEFPFKCEEGAKITFWPGRMQEIKYLDKSNILLDCAHNPSGMFRAIDEISNNYKDVNKIIFGCTKQTNLDLFLQPLINFINHSEIDSIILTEPQGGRTDAVSTSTLLQKLSLFSPNIKFEEKPNPIEAMSIGHTSRNNGTLLCIGSLYLIGNILKILELDSSDSMEIFRK
jgi:folylpolyglutamate synthase/dihydropteroate synthase